MKRTIIIKTVIYVMLTIFTTTTAEAQRYYSIRPGMVWLDTEGKPIQAHGFQVTEIDGTFYWYGENKEHTIIGSNVWTYGIRCYKSKDLYNWEDCGLIIPPDTVNHLSPLHYSQTLDRPHIIYNEKTRKYVCWIKSMDTDGYFVILQSDNIMGPYDYVRSLKPHGFGVGDFDMYVDKETGKGYVWFERPHYEMICAELSDDFLNVEGTYSKHFVGMLPPYTREAPSHFVRNGKHYMFTSGTTGYVPNPSLVSSFNDYHGEYTNLGDPHIGEKLESSFCSQITCVIKIPGKHDLYVALADRWLPQLEGTDIPQRVAKDKIRHYLNHKPFPQDFSEPKTKDKRDKKRSKWDATSHATYVWLPVIFDKDGTPRIEWKDEWRLEDYDIPTRNQVGPTVMPKNIEHIDAPFAMQQIQRPMFPTRRSIVKMSKKGMSTKAIQNAIDKMSAKGGGTVVIPDGNWHSGRIELKSNVELHLSDKACINFSGEVKDYLPVVFTRDEGIEIFSLGACIYACEAENIALTGKGTIVGPSTDCEIYQINKETALNIEKIAPNRPLEERIYDGIQNKEVFLPKTFAPINCKNVLIEGITLNNGLYWNVVPQYCENVIIRGVTVNSFGHGRTDGIDIESSKNVLVEYCSLDCQDDCYTMKSGRGIDGVRVGKPTENVVIRYCIALRGAGGIVCGTEVAGGIRNIYMHDCVFDGTDQAFRFKTLRSRGGGVENIYVERVRANLKGPAFYCDMLGSIKWGGDLAKRHPVRPINNYTPDFHSIVINNVVIENCKKFIEAIGLPERPLRNVLFSNVKARCIDFAKIRDVESFVIQNAEITADNTEVYIDGTTGIMMLNVNVNGRKPENIKYNGEKSTRVIIK